MGSQPYYGGGAPQAPPTHVAQQISGQKEYIPYAPTTNMPHQYTLHTQMNRQLPVLATLDLPDLSLLTNDPILYNLSWPPIPHKLPSDIPNFDGKPGEYPNTHVMTYHLWCSSNSLIDDSIRLRLFQQTLTGVTSKWYIELSHGTFLDFNILDFSFLTHFQLPIWYETSTELFTSLHQSTTTHISDHIHEWRWSRRLIKSMILD
jgi:hypothetical protein